MAESTVIPEIKGVEDSKKSDAKVAEVDETMEQSKEMDLELPEPVDTVEPSRDLKQTQTEQAKQEDAKNVTKRKMSAVQIATLAKAREAKAAKRQRLKEEPLDGNPAPDPFQVMHAKFESMEGQFQRTFDLLQDLQKRLPVETALQNEQVIPAAPIQTITLPSQSNVKQEVQMESVKYPPVDSTVSSMTNKRPREVEQDIDEDDVQFLKKLRRYQVQNKRALDEVTFHHPKMEERATREPSMGPSSQTSTDVLMW
jgi:hypothetical protein